MSKIEEQSLGKKEGEIRYLTPLNISTSNQRKYCRFKRSGIKLGGEQNFVEIGDFNNDKKPDVIFSVNNNKSKIFINSN